MIVQPSGSLLGSFGMILAHNNVPQSQSVGLKYRHDPTEADQCHNLRISV